MKNILSFTIITFLIFIPGLNSALFSSEIPGNQISGTVTTRDNQPLEYVSVTLVNFGINTTTDSSGRYKFSNVPEGSYLLSFRLTGYEFKTLEVKVKSENNIIDIKLEETLIQTPVIDITGSTNPSGTTNSVYSVTSINSSDFSKQRNQNLSETIRNIPGVNNISTGTNIGKPVIRGLSSNSVLIIHDGVKIESQQWGDEHGPELSLFDLDRIEILRGPASLLYGSDGIGGVVNVISKPLEFSINHNLITYGELLLGGYSVNNQGFGNLTLGLGSKNYGVKGHFGYRKAGNTKTPAGIFLVNNTEGGKDTIHGGVLSNSGSEESEGGASIGFNGSFGNLNLGFETFRREIQMHDADPLAAASQKLNTNQFEMEGYINLPASLKLEPVISYQLQRRKEYENTEDKNNDITALNLLLKTIDAKLNLHHSLFNDATGTFGVSFNSQENTTTGIEKLIPNYNAYSTGVFLVESYETKKFKISIGGRYDHKKLNIKRTIFEEPDTANGIEGNILNDRSLNFDAFTGSIGFVYKLGKSFDLYSNIGRGWRAPTEFELFVDGEHEGTGRYERGLAVIDNSYTPKPEESVNADIGIRIKFSSLKADFSFYRNQINNFIYPSPAGDTLNELPVYNVKQDKSSFIGYEYMIQFQPVKWLLLSAEGDYVKTKNEASENPLPFTPAMKNILRAKVQKKSIGKFYNPYLSFSSKIVSPQNNVDPLEAKTDGYVLFNAGLGFEFEFAGSIAAVDFSVDNLFDTKYADHLSRYKSYALNPGRSINVELTLPFRY